MRTSTNSNTNRFTTATIAAIHDNNKLPANGLNPFLAKFARTKTQFKQPYQQLQNQKRPYQQHF